MELEQRYIVIKKEDLRSAVESGLIGPSRLEIFLDVCRTVELHRRRDLSKPEAEYLVINRGWPEYDAALAALAQRVDAGG